MVKMIQNPEYLFAFHEALCRGDACSIGISGDSTSTAFFIDDNRMDPLPFFLSFARSRGFSAQSFLDLAHSGNSIQDWATTHVVNDRPKSLNAYILRWGINRWAGSTAEGFETYLRQGLSYYRNGPMCSVGYRSILLCTPNMISEDTTGRNEAWISEISEVIRAVGKDFHCTVLDLATAFPDAETGSGIWLDNPSAAGGIHPKSVLAAKLFGLIGELLYPESLSYVAGNSRVQVALASGIYPVGQPPVAARSANIVTMEGIVSSPGGISYLKPIAQLPANMRPSSVSSLVLTATDGAGTYQLIPAQISADGWVRALAASGLALVTLGGTSFIPS